MVSDEPEDLFKSRSLSKIATSNNGSFTIVTRESRNTGATTLELHYIALSGVISSRSVDKVSFSLNSPVALEHIPATKSYVLESAWRLCKGRALTDLPPIVFQVDILHEADAHTFDRPYLDKLPVKTRDTLFRTCREALQADRKLLDELTYGLETEVDQANTETFVEYVLFFLGGHTAEVIHSWPKEQLWCID